ncbi:MAG: glycosyltransferase [Patescibacteria group bacterium]
MPSVSIVIPTFNLLEITKECITNIFRHTPHSFFELIIVDNGSDQKTLQYLQSIEGINLIKNKENLGFAKACNQGMKASKGEHILLLNNDIVVTPGWIEKLVACLSSDQTIGLVGPMTNYSGELQVDSGAKYKKIEEMFLYAQKFTKKNRRNWFEFHRIAGFCFLIKRQLFDKIGYLDERFGLGFYEDDDYCKRAREAGYKIMIAGDVFVHHYGNKTFQDIGKQDPSTSDLRMRLNRDIFLEKWFSEKNRTLREKPLVSVLMATYNRRKFLPRAIKSMLDQAYQNFELIIINDGGEDVGDIVETFQDTRIKYITTKHLGKSNALNIAIAKAKGHYIAYADDDDIHYPDHLDVLVGAMLENPQRQIAYTDMAQTDYMIDQDEDIKVISRKSYRSREYDKKRLFEYNDISNFLIHKKNLFDKVGLFDENLLSLEDWDMWRRFSAYADFFHVKKITGEYFVDVKKASRNDLIKKDRKIYNEIWKKIIAKDLTKAKKITPEDLIQEGKKLELKKEYTSALKSYKQALQEEPFHAICCQRIGVCYRQLQNWQESDKYFRKSIQLRPDIFETYFIYAKLLIIEKNYLEAKRNLEIALLLNQSEYLYGRTIYRLLGDCYKGLDKEKTAQQCYKKSRELKKLHPTQLSKLVKKIKYYNKEEGFISTLKRAGSYLFRRLTNFLLMKKLDNNMTRQGGGH